MVEHLSLGGESVEKIIDALETGGDCYYIDRDGERVKVHIIPIDPNRVVTELVNY